MAAVKLRLEGSARANVQRAHSLRPVNFVRGDGKEIHAESVHVEWQLPRGLHRVAMEIDVCFGGDAPDFLDWLDRTDFVVGVHHADENRFRAQSAADIFGLDDAEPRHGDERDVHALLFKRLAAFRTA